MKRYIFILLTVLLTNVAFAQDFFDALRYSQTDYNGTARSMAMGSAFGALGGDFISTSINPAGLGLYRGGEFSVTPNLNINQVESSYLNNSESNNKYSFNLNNLSYVGTAKTGATNGVISVTFGFGYNRLKNFNSNILVQGYDANTTLLNYFTDYANRSTNENSFDYHHEGLAWNTWLIDVDSDPNVIEGRYFNDLTNYNSYEIYDDNNNYVGIGYEPASVKPHQQKHRSSSSGRVDEYTVSLGMNINHKIYVGASVGFVDLYYREAANYSEIDNLNNIDFFNNYTLRTDVTDSGYGLNFKLGLIYRPLKSLRFGASIHTPTFYTITRYSDKNIVANFDSEIGNDNTGYNTQWEDKNQQDFDYKLETPIKANFSAAYLFGKRAILSADYEYIDYNGSKFRNAGDGYDYSDKNSDISGTMLASSNIRIGGEFRVTPNFSLRTGYNILGNPWESSFTFNDGTTEDIVNREDSFFAYTFGCGYRQESFFIDLAYKINQTKTTFKVHDMDVSNPSGGTNLATLNALNNQATVTFGFRF